MELLSHSQANRSGEGRRALILFFDVRAALFLFAGVEHALKSPLPASPVYSPEWIRVYAAVWGGAPY
ncbi:MAG: hypothetical protein CMP30_03585 [Roseibacillus sp.]|nr:hypothetical protein [Roseibacillus sp.]